VSASTTRPLAEVAHAFFLAGEQLYLDWLEGRVAGLPDATRWERWAAQALVDDLMALRRDAALRVLQTSGGPIDRAFEGRLSSRAEAHQRLGRLVDALGAQGDVSLAALTVALRQVRGLVG